MSAREEFNRMVLRSMYTRGSMRFDLRADHAVVIVTGTHDAEETRQVAIIPANEWASVVAAMSSGDESAVTFSLALALHNAGCAYDPDAHQHETEPPA